MRWIASNRATSDRRGKWRRRAGAILETVIVMPLLVMLTFGAVEYSYFFYIKNAFAGAARNGVRAAILASATNTNTTAAITASLSASNIGTGAYTVTFLPTDVSTAAAGATVRVTITASWSAVGISPLAVGMGGIAPTKQVLAAAVMMKE